MKIYSINKKQHSIYGTIGAIFIATAHFFIYHMPMQNVMKDMLLFVEVAACKSFTLAANNLEIPTSTLSRRIAALEKSLGVRLFNRNSRHVELTDPGKTFFERCDSIVSEAHAAREALTTASKTISGKIRLAAPPDFCLYCSAILIDFARLYPDISLEVQLQQSWVDIIGDAYDLNIRVGDMPSSNLVARKLNEFSSALYASPKLLETYATPQHPNDLLDIPTIRISRGTLWKLHKEDETVIIAPNSSFTVNSITLVADLTTAGLGVAELGTGLGDDFMKEGLLVPILPDWHLPSIPVYAVTASKDIPNRVSLFIDFLSKRLQSVVPLATLQQAQRHRKVALRS